MRSTYLWLESTESAANVTFGDIIQLFDGSCQEAVSKRSIAQQDNVALFSCSRNAVLEHFGAPKREFDLGEFDWAHGRGSSDGVGADFRQAHSPDLAFVLQFFTGANGFLDGNVLINAGRAKHVVLTPARI